MTATVVTDPSELVLPAGPIALDTEFHAERRYTPALHLIQVCGADGAAFIIDPHVPGLLESTGPLLLAHDWIVHAGRIDLDLMERAIGAVPAVVFDTQIAAGLVSAHYPMGLARMCEERLGMTLDKSETLSDWSRRPLDETQIAYAASDVTCLHELWDGFMADAERLDRQAIVLDACATHRERAITPPALDEAWLTLNGRHGLGPERAVVLAELAAWREETARAMNQAPQSVLPHGVLFDLAKRRPLTKDSLMGTRRAPRGALQRHADAILERIARASARPDWGRPRTLGKGTVSAARFSWLGAWATVRGTESAWSARLAFPEKLRERVALGDPITEVLTPWQSALFGTELAEDLGSDRGLLCPAIPA